MSSARFRITTPLCAAAFALLFFQNSALAIMMGPVLPERGLWRVGVEGTFSQFELERDNLPADRAEGRDLAAHSLLSYSVLDRLELTALVGLSGQNLVDKVDPVGGSAFNFSGGSALAWGGHVGWIPWKKKYYNLAIRGGYYEHGDHTAAGSVSPALSDRFWHGYGAIQMQANHARNRRLWSYVGGRFSESRIEFVSIGPLGFREYESRTKFGAYAGFAFEFKENWEGAVEAAGGDAAEFSLRLMRRF